MFEIRFLPDAPAALIGRLDAAQSDRAMQTLTELPGPLTLDCSQLDYISSAGLSVLIETYKRQLAVGHRLRLEGVTPRVRSVIALARLDQLLELS